MRKQFLPGGSSDGVCRPLLPAPRHSFDRRERFPLRDLTEAHAQVLDKPGAAWLMMSRQSCVYALSARHVAKAVSCDARAAPHIV